MSQKEALPHVKNSIIANNTATNNFGTFGVNNIQRNCASGGFQASPAPYFTNGGNNLEWPTRTDLTNNGLCTPSITVADPRLDNAVRDNGGAVPTLALLAGSAAIDAGAGCTTTDQRGVARVGTCDIGAFEFGGTVTSIIETDGINKLRVYPNPTNTQKLFIEIPTEIRARELEIVIVNNLGASVQKMNVLSNEEKVMIDLNNLPIGTYVLITKSNKTTYTSKIIVE